MSRACRQIGSRSAPASKRPPLPAEIEVEVDPIVPPSDPARIAARLMIEHALEAVGVTIEDAGRDGAVCVVVVPAVGWTGIVRDEWQTHARGGKRCCDGLSDWLRCAGCWTAWAPTDAPRRGQSAEWSATLADAIWQGVHCFGVASDLDWLPGDLVQAADVRLHLVPLTGTDLSTLARNLCCDEPTVSVSDGEAAALTPRLVRLARRQGQRADEYLRKLCELIEREHVTAAPAISKTPVSPRDAPTLDRLHGMNEAVAWGLNLAQDLAAYAEGTLPWSAVDPGCLLSGPPGCGKTLFARALATTCDVPLISGSYGQWLGSGAAHQGDMLKAMRASFVDARANAPCILFIDEVDSFPDRAQVSHRYREWDTQVVNALLAEIDGVHGRDGVIIIAACNHPDKLDPALIRSGRLDRQIRIGLPDREALGAILREHLGAEAAAWDLSGAALFAAGSSGADCERYVRVARRRARIAGRLVELNDLVAEIGGEDCRSAADLRLAAIHEAGHAVAILLLTGQGLGAVSIQETAQVGGRTSLTAGSSDFLRAGDVHNRVVALLAGRAAEEEILGSASSGAGGGPESDLAKATSLAALAVTALGFDDEAGLVWQGMSDPLVLPGLLGRNSAVSARVRLMLDRGYAEARQLVRTHRTAIEALANTLLERRVIDGADAAAIVARWQVA